MINGFLLGRKLLLDWIPSLLGLPSASFSGALTL